MLLLNEFLTKRRAMVAAGALAILAGLNVPYEPVVFVGESMSPTYPNHSFAVASRDVKNLKRGDVVIVQMPFGTIVKRVHFVEGDSYWRMKDGPTGYTDLIGVHPRTRKFEQDPQFSKVTLPRGKVYLLGDNYSGSTDSRAFGYVDVSQVKAVLLNPRPEPKSSKNAESPLYALK